MIVLKKAIAKGKHIFIEKPITNTVEEAEHIRQLLAEHDIRGQVGHVERFNPAFTAVKSSDQQSYVYRNPSPSRV